MKPYVVAVDIGTTSTKAVAVDREGGIRATVSVEYSLNTLAPDRAEQNPNEITEAAANAVAGAKDQAKARADEVRCIVFNSAMHSLIALDGKESR
ncbi:hypothetical protein FPL14_24580 [Cohnella cholangitidis]|uniref:Carbohydrate kinase FGGY N-terminal domain-containing protein n=1 Tax=Cohnella cholangitidis TaxID=2598458 RepID=A0A7G5C461_9BACL|nr:FGGY family carbohydrate kinase [Cohnella cholangitidis]QMV43995.1 hypothetical protein FPL14_24580 [Cohnella cholangitidis]